MTSRVFHPLAVAVMIASALAALATLAQPANARCQPGQRCLTVEITDPYDKIANPLYQRGVSLYNQGKPDEALKLLSESAAKIPADIRSLIALGMLHFGEGRREEAFAWFDRAVAMDENYARARYERANAMLLSGGTKMAIADFDKAIELDPTFHAAYRGRAKSHLAEHQYAEAKADFDVVIERYQFDLKSRVGRAEALLGLHQFEAALADLDEVLDYEPEDKQALRLRALAHRALGNEKQAKEDFKAFFPKPARQTVVVQGKGGSQLVPILLAR